MRNPSPPPAAAAVVVLLLLLASNAAGVSYTASSIEITFALEALRNHDYNLFANAIATSDLQYQILTTIAGEDDGDPISTFTIFAPKDDSLFAVDMATEAPVYVDVLRYHSVPNRRLTFSELQNLSSPILDTLLPRYAVFVGRTVDGDLYENAVIGVMVDGIRVSDPDLFLGSRIAVHGIDGILLTGLNMHRDFGGTGPVESPAPGPDRSDKVPAPEPAFGWRNIPGAPDGNIPAAAPLKMKLKTS